MIYEGITLILPPKSKLRIKKNIDGSYTCRCTRTGWYDESVTVLSLAELQEWLNAL